MPHLIVFSHLRWNFVYQRPQQLLSRLAKHYPVTFVEEPIHDGDAVRLARSTPAAGVEVLQPHTPVEAPGFHDDQLPLLQPMLTHWMRDRGISEGIAWLCTPMALPLLADIAPRAVIYDCMDELAAFRDAPKQLRQREAALLRCAQLVLTGGPSLFEAKRALHPNVLCLPSAVDAPHYTPQIATAKLDLMLRAEQIQGRIPGPRLGFFGVIDERVDTKLLADVADAEPDWQVIMVGPIVRIDPASLPQRRNIHWLGQQPYQLLPQLVADWDVCLLPFALNDATRYLSPTKTLEYMAAEKPIVSTALHDVVAMYGDVVRIGADKASFIDACRWALSETAYKRAERIGEMLATVSRFSWDNTTRCVHEAIEQIVAKRLAQGGPALPLQAQDEAVAAELPADLRQVAASLEPTTSVVTATG